MANPVRMPDPRDEARNADPLNPIPPAADPVTPGARNPANDPRVVNRVETRSGGSSVMIAAIVLVLAVIAYFVFAPGSQNAPPAPGEPAVTTTEPATPAPAAPAPDATAPAAPADPVTPAPDATAPAAPADPAAPAPESSAPAPAEPAPAPAEPAPAQ